MWTMIRCMMLAAVLAVAVSGPVAAAQCGRHEKVTAFLAEKYKERVAAMGLISDKGLMQLFVAASGTWTVLVTTSQGVSCIVAAGQSFERIEMPEKSAIGWRGFVAPGAAP